MRARSWPILLIMASACAEPKNEVAEGPRLLPVATLNSDKSAIVPTMAPNVAQLSTGQYAVTYNGGVPQVAFFDSSGLRATSYESKGTGPGSISNPPIVVVQGDTIIAFDQQRIVRLDGSLNHLRTSMADAGFSRHSDVLATGYFVAAMPIRASNGRWYSLAILDNEGRLIKPLEEVDNPNSGIGTLIGAANDGGFWMMRTNSDRLVRYTPRFEATDTVIVDRPWFKPWDAIEPGVRRGRNGDVVQLDHGRLLVTTWIPDPSWVPNQSSGVVNVQTVNLSGAFDSRVDLIDAATGAVLSSTPSPDALMAVRHAPGKFYSTRREHTGHVAIDIWYCTCADSGALPAVGTAALR